MARSEGFEVSSFDRNVANNEKQVDVAIAKQILGDSFQYMKPGDKVVLVSGDRDHLPVVNSLNRRASTRPVAFCNTTGKDLKQPPVSYFALDDLFDYLTRRNSGSRGLQLSAVRSTVRCRGDSKNDWERSMAKLTEEQKAAQALTRKRNEAVRAEEEHARQQAKERDWEERGLRLTYEELVAREPCRGCGEAILDGLEPFPGTMYLSPEQKVEYDAREAAYKERHGECRAHRWSMGGSRQLHCGFCCPPPPLNPRQIEDLTKLMAAWKKPDPKEMDTWELTLRCDHAVHKVIHHSNEHVYASVVDCPESHGGSLRPNGYRRPSALLARMRQNERGNCGRLSGSWPSSGERREPSRSGSRVLMGTRPAPTEEVLRRVRETTAGLFYPTIPIVVLLPPGGRADAASWRHSTRQ